MLLSFLKLPPLLTRAGPAKPLCRPHPPPVTTWQAELPDSRAVPGTSVFGPEVRACPPSCPCAQPQGTNPGQRPPVPDTCQQQRQGALRCCARQARTRTSRASGAALRLGAVHPSLAVHEQPAAPWSPPDQAGARPVCKMRPERAPQPRRAPRTCSKAQQLAGLRFSRRSTASR